MRISTGELKVILLAANPWIGDSNIVLDYSLEYSASNLRSLLVFIFAGGWLVVRILVQLTGI